MIRIRSITLGRVWRARMLALFIVSVALFLVSIPFSAFYRDDRIGMVELYACRLEFSPRQGLIDLQGADPAAPVREWRIGRASDPPQWDNGFVWWFTIDGGQEVSQTKPLPLWMPACTGLLGLGAGFLPRAFRGSRSRRGLCAKCGYDLRGLPTGVPCPECGKAARTG